MAPKKADPKRERLMIDMAELVDEVNRYPQAAGIDSDVWAELSYTQKVKLLVRRQIASVRQEMDANEDQ